MTTDSKSKARQHGCKQAQIKHTDRRKPKRSTKHWLNAAWSTYDKGGPFVFQYSTVADQLNGTCVVSLWMEVMQLTTDKSVFDSEQPLMSPIATSCPVEGSQVEWRGE